MEPVTLLDLDEIRSGWEVTDYRVYKLVNAGKLTTVTRPGHQRFYLLSEVEAILGPRKTAPTPR